MINRSASASFLKNPNNYSIFNDIVYWILFALLLFPACLSEWNVGSIGNVILQYYDEFIAVIFLIYLIPNIKIVKKYMKKEMAAIVILFVICSLSSLIFQIQSIIPTLADILICNKFIIGYFASYVYLIKNKITLKLTINRISKVLTVLLFLIALHDLLFDPFYPKSEFRYFTYSLTLMFPHATYLSAACITLLISLGYSGKNRKSDLIYMLMISFVAFFTLRGKTLGFLTIYWILYLNVFYLKSNHLKYWLILGIVFSILVAHEQIERYFFSENYSPRLILLKDGVKLALNHFPFGTGWGTFGSTMASQYYSEVYVGLGYLNNFGMTPEYSAFLTDSFWPIILGQFGFIGFLVFVYLVYRLAKHSFVVFKYDKRNGFAMIAVLIYMLITSFAETSFFNPTSFLLFILFGIFEAEAYNKRKEIERVRSD